MMKWGIFGTGYVSGMFVDGIKSAHNGQVYAVASRSLTTAKKFAEEHGADVYYGSYQELIEDDDADVYYIGLPNNIHLEYVEALLKRKKHVLCEKPLGMNAKQTVYMVELARENGVFFMEAMWTRCFPCFKKMREWVQNGDIGEVNLLEASFGIASDSRWRRDPIYGGGALLDVGIYPLALAFAVFGTEYEQIGGIACLNDKGIDIQNTFSLSYNGAKMACMSSSLEYVTDNRVVIYGDKGQITMDGEWWHPKSVAKKTGKPVVFNYEFEDTEVFSQDYTGAGMQFEVDHVAECIEKGLTESPLMTLDETVAIAKALDSLREQFGVVYPEDH